MTVKLDVIESLTNTVGGAFIACAVYYFASPFLGIQSTFSDAIEITAVMWVVSTVRLFTFRRFFRWIEAKTQTQE